jgi:ubiquinone/menaquinone biosynthesis C-methylase UbiE
MKNQKKTKRNNSGVYKGTYEYYAKYRPAIPKEVIDIIVEHFDIKPTDRVLDLGCGTGQVALAMDGKCREMICLDLDPEMIKWAKKATKNCKIKLRWINRPAEDLGKLKEKLGTFKVATSCRAFHRMNQDQVLKNLDDLIEENGGVAVFSDYVLWNGIEEWQLLLKKVIQKYLGEEKLARKSKFKESEERWEDILAHSAFRFIKTSDVQITRTWDVESIIGYVFSTAAAAPPLFGSRLNKFKEEVKNTLLSINPKGVFQENAVWSMVLGSKKPHD